MNSTECVHQLLTHDKNENVGGSGGSFELRQVLRSGTSNALVKRHTCASFTRCATGHWDTLSSMSSRATSSRGAYALEAPEDPPSALHTHSDDELQTFQLSNKNSVPEVGRGRQAAGKLCVGRGGICHLEDGECVFDKAIDRHTSTIKKRARNSRPCNASQGHATCGGGGRYPK